MDAPTRIGLCVCALLVLIVGAVWAAPGVEERQPWTLEHCIRMARERHGSALAAAENVEAARAQRRSAGSSLYWPTLSARSTRSEGRTEAEQRGGAPQRAEVTSDEQHILSATITLFDGGTQRQTVRQARAGEMSADASYRRTRQLLTYEVTNAYVRLLRARHGLLVAVKQIEQAYSQRALVEGRIEAGAAAPVDIYPIEVQIASARVNQLRIANDVRVAGSALRNAMGLDSGPVPEIADLPNDLPEAPPLEECVAQALQARPDIEQATANIERSRASLALTRLRSLPQLVSTGSWDRGLGASSIATQWSVNAGLSWRFWDRGDRAGIDAAAANVRALEEQRQQLDRDIAAEVEQAHLSLASARERVAAGQVSVAMAHRNLEAAEAKYSLGLAIPVEIVDAQVALSNAELQAIEARYDYFLASAQLDRAMGREVVQ